MDERFKKKLIYIVFQHDTVLASHRGYMCIALAGGILNVHWSNFLHYCPT